MQSSPKLELFGSPYAQFVYDSSVPVTLDTNDPSDVTSVPSINNLLMELPGSKIFTCIHCEMQCRSVDRGLDMQEITFRYLFRLN